MAQVSVIVPMHNVQDYVGECVQSLRTQTFGDFEVLCIDDASQDATLERAQAAAEGDGDLYDGRGDAYCGMLNCSYNLGMRHLKAYIPSYPVGTADDIARMIGEFVPIARAVIGLKKETRKQTSQDWCCWGDWQLWYFGEEVPTGIEEIQNTNAIAAPTQRSIYNLGGAKVNQLQRGFNIVRTVDAEGNVKVQKIFVK